MMVVATAGGGLDVAQLVSAMHRPAADRPLTIDVHEAEFVSVADRRGDCARRLASMAIVTHSAAHDIVSERLIADIWHVPRGAISWTFLDDLVKKVGQWRTV